MDAVKSLPVRTILLIALFASTATLSYGGALDDFEQEAEKSAHKEKPQPSEKKYERKRSSQTESIDDDPGDDLAEIFIQLTGTLMLGGEPPVWSVLKLAVNRNNPIAIAISSHGSQAINCCHLSA